MGAHRKRTWAIYEVLREWLPRIEGFVREQSLVDVEMGEAPPSLINGTLAEPMIDALSHWGQARNADAQLQELALALTNQS